MGYNYFRGCPFCGRHGYSLHATVYSDGEHAWTECRDCGATGPKVARLPEEYASAQIEAARGAWNARAIQDKTYMRYIGAKEADRHGEKNRKQKEK